jgi:hypothetical protein
MRTRPRETNAVSLPAVETAEGFQKATSTAPVFAAYLNTALRTHRKHLPVAVEHPDVPSARSVLRALLAVAGAALLLFGAAMTASGLGAEGFPGGLAVVFGFFVLAAGGGVAGAALLLSGAGLRPVQTRLLQFAGALGVLAFLGPALALLVVPGAVIGEFGVAGVGGAVFLWLVLTALATVVAVAVGCWRAAELAYDRFAS